MTKRMGRNKDGIILIPINVPGATGSGSVMAPVIGDGGVAPPAANNAISEGTAQGAGNTLAQGSGSIAGPSGSGTVTKS